ncbi:MAG TPA: M23 family metallopeptidase [Dermatophilaceae bacterium]|nr:M23 family metallopeptidase [Dermatophilaceae bacterium]
MLSSWTGRLTAARRSLTPVGVLVVVGGLGLGAAHARAAEAAVSAPDDTRSTATGRIVLVRDVRPVSRGSSRDDPTESGLDSPIPTAAERVKPFAVPTVTVEVAPPVAAAPAPEPVAPTAPAAPAVAPVAVVLPDPGAPKSGFVRPVTGVTTSGFGLRIDPLTHDVRLHSGIDFAVACGTPVTAVRAGQVSFAGVLPSYGGRVVIDHGGGLSTTYNHLSRYAAVPGQQAKQGQIIGYVGSTGSSTGCHLHFEVRRGTAVTDPKPYLAGAPSPKTVLPPAVRPKSVPVTPPAPPPTASPAQPPAAGSTPTPPVPTAPAIPPQPVAAVAPGAVGTSGTDGAKTGSAG